MRIAIVRDQDGMWFVRRVAYNVQDNDKGEMVYHCDQHISGPHASLDRAVSLVKEKGLA